jgi:predicted TIM-barrel fold metal-dependent hydrolase
VIGFGTVQPASPDAGREVERCARLGLRGIGELNADAQGWSLEDPDLERVVRPSITADLLWTLHCSDPDRRNHPGKGTANPQRVERLAHRFPDLRIICAHLGGGLPLDSARSGRNGRGAELWPNLWFDTAAAPYLYEPASYKQVVDACGAGRLLFGSDHPLLDAPRYIDALRSAHLDEAEMSLVMGDAAADLLRL